MSATEKPKPHVIQDQHRCETESTMKTFILLGLLLSGAVAGFSAEPAESAVVDSGKLLLEAKQKFQSGRTDDSLEILARLLLTQPTNSEAIFFRARVHESRSHFDKA